ncbi:MAG: hypothetical protein R3B99_18455 [Polyangiales bacterium]
MTGGVGEVFSRRCSACGWWARRSVTAESCRACGAGLTGGRSTSGARAPRPDLGITLDAFFHTGRDGRERVTGAVRDVFGVELEATPEARREVARRLRALATLVDHPDDDGGPT